MVDRDKLEKRAKLLKKIRQTPKDEETLESETKPETRAGYLNGLIYRLQEDPTDRAALDELLIDVYTDEGQPAVLTPEAFTQVIKDAQKTAALPESNIVWPDDSDHTIEAAALRAQARRLWGWPEEMIEEFAWKHEHPDQKPDWLLELEAADERDAQEPEQQAAQEPGPPGYLDTEEPNYMDTRQEFEDPTAIPTTCDSCGGVLITLKHIYQHVWNRAGYVLREDPTAPPEYHMLSYVNDTQLHEMFEHAKKETVLSASPSETAWVLAAFQHEFETREPDPLDCLDTEAPEPEDEESDREATELEPPTAEPERTNHYRRSLDDYEAVTEAYLRKKHDPAAKLHFHSPAEYKAWAAGATQEQIRAYWDRLSAFEWQSLWDDVDDEAGAQEPDTRLSSTSDEAIGEGIDPGEKLCCYPDEPR